MLLAATEKRQEFVQCRTLQQVIFSLILQNLKNVVLKGRNEEVATYGIASS